MNQRDTNGIILKALGRSLGKTSGSPPMAGGILPRAARQVAGQDQRQPADGGWDPAGVFAFRGEKSDTACLRRVRGFGLEGKQVLHRSHFAFAQ